MSRRQGFSSIWRGAIGACLVLSAAGCDEVVSLEPTIGDSQAVAAPGLLGEWNYVDEDGHDLLLVRIAPGSDSTSYLVTTLKTNVVSGSLDRTTWSLRVAPIGDRLLAEVIPSRDDTLVKNLWGSYYGAGIQLAYKRGVLELAADEIRLWIIVGDSVRTVLRAGRCPSPGRVLGLNEGDLVLLGNSNELRKTTECLVRVPALLLGPNVIRRAPTSRRSAP